MTVNFLSGRNKDGIPKNGLIPSMFVFTAIAMILTGLAGVISTIIDGMITSRFLGENAYSAISLLGPFVSVLLLIAGFISTGNEIVCSRHLGKGEKDEANAVFSVCSVIIILTSAALVVICLFAPRFLISVCGVSMDGNPELYPLMDRYVYGFLFGIPALMLVQLISPVLVMDGSGKLLPISSAVLCGVNIAGDLISVKYLNAGIFGIGLSTSIATYAQLLVLLTHFIRRKGLFRLSPRFYQVFRMIEVAKAGSPSLIRRAASVLRDLIINRYNLVVALTTAAVAAKGMQNDLNLLMFCMATGISRTLLTMSSVYYSAEDLQGLKRLFSYAMKFGVILTGSAGAILALAAPAIAGFYTKDPEVTDMFIFSIRWMALSLVFDNISISYQHYLQGIHRKRIVNIISVGERFALPVLLALAMGKLFGSKGILASVAVVKILLVLIIFICLCVKRKGIPRRWEDLMLLPQGFGGREDDNLYGRVTSIDEAVPLSQSAYQFCMEHETDNRTAKLIFLFTEEMVTNVFRHGRERRLGSYGLDYRLAINGGKITLTFRDLCVAFDPVQWWKLHQERGSQENIGIHLVLSLAKEVRYFNAFQSNNVIIYLDRRTADAG